MSFVDDLGAELTARRVPPAARARILAEYADHLGCEPAAESRMGEPSALAASFAADLATTGARRAARDTFGALVLTAVAVLASQIDAGVGDRSQDLTTGHSVVLAVVAVLLVAAGSQVALAGGGLAALRVLRRRRADVLPDLEVALVHRRALVGVGGGLAATTGLLAAVANAPGEVDGGWLLLQGGLAAGAAIALVRSGARITTARRIVGGVQGPMGDLRRDLPLPTPLLRAPWALGAGAAGGVAATMTAVVWHAERSLAEGLQRGVTEGVLVLLGFLVLGRLVGARPAPPVQGVSRG